MKANARFVNEEEAVSPVIAVILMVAITVVLAATVFVLVNDLGKNVGSTGPSLGLVSDSSGSSGSQWTVKVSSATKLADLTDYRFVFTTASHGVIVALNPDSTFTTANVMYGVQDTLDTSRKDASSTTPTAANMGYSMSWTDIDGNSKWSVGDKLDITYDDDAADEGTPDSLFADAFASGEYTMEILHIPSGSSAGSLPRTF